MNIFKIIFTLYYSNFTLDFELNTFIVHNFRINKIMRFFSGSIFFIYFVKTAQINTDFSLCFKKFIYRNAYKGIQLVHGCTGKPFVNCLNFVKLNKIKIVNFIWFQKIKAYNNNGPLFNLRNVVLIFLYYIINRYLKIYYYFFWYKFYLYLITILFNFW